MTTKLRTPPGYDTIDELLTMDAGRAYVLSQLDPESNAIQPEHKFRSSRTNCDASWYEIYEDDSLWFVNNAEDEVWADYRDFVRDSLVPGLQSSLRGMCWDEDEYDASTSMSAWLLDDMDRKILLLYCDDDEAAARDLAGIPPVTCE